MASACRATPSTGPWLRVRNLVARAKDAVDYRLLARPQVSAQTYGDLSDLDLKNALLSVWRHKAIVFWTALLCAFLAAAIVLAMTPMYTATVKVLLQEQKDPTFGVAGLETTPDDQLAVATSNIVAERVVDRLSLSSDPEFNEALQSPPAWAAYIPRIPRPEWLNTLLGRNRSEPTEDTQSRVQRENIVGAFLDRLEVVAAPNSSVLEINFSSERPVVAARIADEVANSYLEQRLEDKFDEVKRTTGWLSERIAELRKQVETAEAAVEAFRRQSGLVGPNPGETVLSQQITELSSELILARTARAERESRRDSLQRLARLGGANVSSAGEVLNSPLINSLINQEVEVKRRLADLAQEYGRRHPQFVNAQAELKDIQDKIGEETRRIAQNMDNEVETAREREQFLQASVRELEVKLADTNSSSVTLRALERDATAARTTLESFLQQFQQFKVQDDAASQQPDATIITKATLPSSPSYPRKTLAVLAAATIGGILGVVLALFRERFDSVFRGSEQVEQFLDLPVVGQVPDMRRTRRVRRRGLPTYVMENPTSAVAELIRGLGARLMNDKDRQSPLCLQFVSAEPEEGKSSLAVSFTCMQAKAGRKVLLIDADLRHSRVARLLGLQGAQGLVDVLSGRGLVADVVQRHEASGLDVLPAGRLPRAAFDILNVRRLQDLLRPLRDSYDLIVIDSPPALSLADSGVIAGGVDGSVFLVRWGSTRKETARFAISQIEASGGRVVGVVLTFINVRRAATYPFGDAGLYYGKHQKYYVN